MYSSEELERFYFQHQTRDNGCRDYVNKIPDKITLATDQC